jgi:hypothetical protein
VAAAASAGATDSAGHPHLLLHLRAEAAGAAPAPQRLEDRGPGLPALRLAWFDVHDAAPFAYDAGAAEVRRLLGGLGIDVQWRRAMPGEVSRDGETQVILLAARPSSPRLSPHTMGAALKDRSIRAIWVFVPNVAWTLGVPSPPRSLSARQERELALALGRVVSHELVHSFAPDHPHSTGLMNSVLGREALLREGLKLDGAAERAFRSALSPAARASQAVSETRSGGAGRF